MDDSSAPATKGGLRELRTEMNPRYIDVVKRLSEMETKLLQAFFTYTELNQKRVATLNMPPHE